MFREKLVPKKWTLRYEAEVERQEEKERKKEATSDQCSEYIKS